MDISKLRELYSQATQGEWYIRADSVYSHIDDHYRRVSNSYKNIDSALIAAMHNALPELLDVWEKYDQLRRNWMDKNELKPCPFCGDDEPRIQPEGDYWEVLCLTCDCNRQGHTYDDAFREWNRRFK